MVLWIIFIHHYITENIPSGNHTKSELEHGHIEIVNLPIENGGSFHSDVNVYRRVNLVR